MRWKILRPSGDCEIPRWTISCGGVSPISSPVEADRALARRRQPRDRAQRRRLAGAVRADQRDDLALLDLERDALERLDVPVEGVDVLELEQRHRLARLLSEVGLDDARVLRGPPAGAPSAIFSPWSSTVMRSETPITTFMSCSISRIVRPRSSRSLRMNSVRRRDSFGFMPAVGSSSSSSFGSEASARAISTRRWSP